MSLRRTTATLACFLLVTSAPVVVSASGASARESDRQQALVAQAAINAATARDVITNTTSAPGKAVVSRTGQTTVEIPTDPADGIEVTTSTGVAVGIGLPGATNADHAQITSEGTAIYTDALPGASVAAQALTDGGVRVLVTIEGGNAPTRYRFPIDVPEGGWLEPQSDGSVNVLDGHARPAGHFDAAWATDATGAPVPTRYRIEGNTIVQVIQHSANYPVVADPHYTWGWVSGTVYFNKSETIKMAASAAFVAALGAFAPPPFDFILVASAGYISLVATWAAADGHCVKVKSTGSVGIYWGSSGDGYCR